MTANHLSGIWCIDFLEIIFPLQHDFAPPHFSQQVNNLMSNHFMDMWIGRGLQLSGLNLLI
jgi:hypothetical protein